MKTPISRMTYGDKKQYKRPFKVALKCWWDWDILPYFKKLDYDGRNPSKKFYRWQKYFGWKKEEWLLMDRTTKTINKLYFMGIKIKEY